MALHDMYDYNLRNAIINTSMDNKPKYIYG